ncbi:molybdenum cofactor guanylyltransferase [Sphingomonas spermidinifaciens]|uniref:Molybdenum cofactor guanylyltransferase n=1 Tax=Sphingomonas spermidinifaciens TaxID=1141889 RepID=A0A2A4B2G6_9SPHN|nr:molybdenum cofactor guanylyltransferase [Sphingomonas spermidinifaciens]PCD01979.1 molybdenum cofactor guanylyltransferase [Sphingomonas spermidinifaciens]
MILGAVLAGGRASRFGSDKGAALFEGRALIDHSLTALGRHCQGLVVVGRDWPGVPSVSDRPAPDLGPLGGLAGALHYALAIGAERVLTLGCDTPLVPDTLLAELVARDTAVFLDGLPVIGIWPASLSPMLDDFVATDPRRSMRGWAARCGAEALAAPPLPNINTPADLDRLG